MKIFYDWEFLEDGQTILPISLGMVSETGNEFYAIMDEKVDQDRNHREHIITRAYRHPWLRANVIPHLPVKAIGSPPDPANVEYDDEWSFDPSHPDAARVMRRGKFIHDLLGFVGSELERTGETTVQLWAYYGAYDHVCLMQLFGPMVWKPDALPMWTHDIMQLAETKGIEKLPRQQASDVHVAEHHALADAWQNLAWWEWLSAKPDRS